METQRDLQRCDYRVVKRHYDNTYLDIYTMYHYQYHVYITHITPSPVITCQQAVESLAQILLYFP